MQQRIYKVYIHVNIVNNKKYIGITKCNPKKRWDYGHGYNRCPHFSSAIKKYGWENFKHEIVLQNLTKQEAEMFEIEMIKYYRTQDRDFGYNIERGGNHIGNMSDETRLKISNSKKGKKPSLETTKKMKLAHKGKKLKDETKQKIKNSLKGRKISDSTKDKMAKSKLANKNPFYKKHVSEEHKKKLSKINSKPVQNITTGKIFKSASDAAKFYKLHKGNLSAVCRKNARCKRCGGYEWKYI